MCFHRVCMSHCGKVGFLCLVFFGAFCFFLPKFQWFHFMCCCSLIVREYKCTIQSPRLLMLVLNEPDKLWQAQCLKFKARTWRLCLNAEEESKQTQLNTYKTYRTIIYKCIICIIWNGTFSEGLICKPYVELRNCVWVSGLVWKSSAPLGVCEATAVGARQPPVPGLQSVSAYGSGCVSQLSWLLDR